MVGNIQGSLKLFDLLTGLVVVRHTYNKLPMSDHIVKILNNWRGKSDKANYGNMLQFRNINKAKFD